MSKLIAIIIATAVVVGGGAFWGGIKYTENKNSSARLLSADFSSLRNLSPEERRERLQELGVNSGGFRGSMGENRGGGFAAGEIIAKDDRSVTVKLANGGSKIVFFSDSTEITQSTSGTASDLTVGRNMVVNGTANSDGSITAQSIQLRPLLNHE